MLVTDFVIYLNVVDTTLLKQLITKYDADIISDFLHINEMNVDGSDPDSVSHATWGFHGTFFVKHRFTKQIMKCYIGHASGIISDKREGFELRIENEFPWTVEEIKKNRWIYGLKKG